MHHIIAPILIMLTTGPAIAGQPRGPLSTAQYAQSQKQWGAAAALFRNALSAGLTLKYKAEALTGLAECALKEGKNKEAGVAFARLFKECPKQAKDLVAAAASMRVGQDIISMKAGPHRPAPQPTTIPWYNTPKWGRLENVVIRKLSYENEPVQSVFEEIAETVRKTDSKGRGMNVVLHVLDKPTITMDFDNIPLPDAVRYICEQAQLRYQVTENAVIIVGKNVEYSPLELRFFHVDPRLFDDDDDLDFKSFFYQKGVTFPHSHRARQAKISYIRHSSTICSWNTPNNNRLMERILKENYCEPPQVAVTAQLIEASSLPRSSPGRTAVLIKRMPDNRKRSIATTSSVVTSGREIVASDRFIKKQNPHRFELKCLPQVDTDGMTIGLDIHWRGTEFAAGAGKVAVWSKMVSQQISVFDGQGVALRLSNAPGNNEKRATYLILRAQIVDYWGCPRRGDEHTSAAYLQYEAEQWLFGVAY